MQALLASFHLISVDDHSLLPPSPRSVSPYQSDDEVVWSPSLSSSSASVAEPGSHSEASDDDDFVLLNKPRKIPRRWSDLINGSDPSNDQSDERDQSPPSRNSPATKQPFIDTTIGAADSGQAGSPASPCTPVDRTAGATPIPASERRIAARPATRSTRSPPVEVPTSTSISASTQEARNQRKSEQATCPKALRKLKRERKKEAKAATAKATTPEDKAKARKERRKAARQRRRDRKMLQKEEAGATARPVPLVTKATPTKPKVITTTTSPEMYEEASRFITSFLADPIAKRDSVCRLTLLQSLIVELGFMSTALPTTLRAARGFIKTHVFLNVREYIAHRGQEQAAIQRLLFPSRNALIKDVRRKGKPASLKWVKQQGLEVLLVSCYNN